MPFDLLHSEIIFPGRAFTRCAQTVYARPDATSFGWARLPRGVGANT